MGRHHRTSADAVLIELDPTLRRGRHREETSGPGAGLKAATVAAATGAILTAGAQLGAGSAAAAPAPAPLQIPAGLLPAGVELPPLPALPQFELPGLPAAPVLPSAQELIQQAKAIEIPAELSQVQDVVDNLTAAAEAAFGSVGSVGKADARAVKPVSGTLTSDFGPRWGSHHGGLDIAAPIGTPVHAAADGVVVDAGPASGFGLWVRVKHDDGTTTVYGHVNDYQVHVGQHVTAGQQIATVGNRGQSTGPHLHFEVWSPGGAKVDPSAWLEERGVAVTWRGASATM